jgi:hypothetical protein
MMPAPAYAEAIAGVGNHPSGDVEEAIDALSWGEVYEINRDLSVEVGRIADEVGPQGPSLDAVNARIAAVGRKLDAPVVSTDGDLTHEKIKQAIEVEEYRQDR